MSDELRIRPDLLRDPMPQFPRVKRDSVVIEPISWYERHGWWSVELGIFLLLAIGSRKYNVTINPVHKVDPIMAARNLGGKQFLSYKDAEWLLQIDNDMAPPSNLLDLLDEAPQDADIIVPMFHLWQEVNCFPALCWRPTQVNSENLRLSEEETKAFLAQKWIPLDSCGSGAIFIRRKVLEQMPYPWFSRLFDSDGRCTDSEDTLFTKAATAKGFKIYGSTAFTVGHYRTTNLAHLHVPDIPITTESFT